MPSGLWIDTSVKYFGMTVDTMPTPMNSMARMQTAISQCSMRCSTVKRVRTPFTAWLPLWFGDSPPPPQCDGHTTSRRPTTEPPGTGRPMSVCRSAARSDRS